MYVCMYVYIYIYTHITESCVRMEVVAAPPAEVARRPQWNPHPAPHGQAPYIINMSGIDIVSSSNVSAKPRDGRPRRG